MSVLGKRGHREGIQTSLFGMDKNYACGARLILNVGHRSLQENIDALPIHSPMVVWGGIGPCPVSSRQLRGVFVTQPNLMLYNQFLHHNGQGTNTPFNHPTLLDPQSEGLHKRLLELCAKINQKFGEPVNHITIQSYDSSDTSKHGRHQDQTNSWVQGSSFFVLSLGHSRIFRVKRLGALDGKEDIILEHGSMLHIPWETNQNYTHEIPSSKKLKDIPRYSIVFRQMRATAMHS